MDPQNACCDASEHVERFRTIMLDKGPFMLPSLLRQRERFGVEWSQAFGEMIGKFAGTSETWLEDAALGYISFCLDGMRLQRKFEKTRRYEAKSYEEAAQQVYHNPEHMNRYYLPGILLSHFLWPHHFEQLLFFNRVMRPLIASAAAPRFCDIGPGTGFYSRQFLTAHPRAEGWAFDISESSIRYATVQAELYGVRDRYHPQIRNVIDNPPDATWPFLLNVEVLEHLEDPLTFLRTIHKMLEPGGYGFITASVTAANEDHIYLYNSGDEVADQLTKADFIILDRQYDQAYEPKADAPVPLNAAFLVTRR